MFYNYGYKEHPPFLTQREQCLNRIFIEFYKKHINNCK